METINLVPKLTDAQLLNNGITSMVLLDERNTDHEPCLIVKKTNGEITVRGGTAISEFYKTLITKRTAELRIEDYKDTDGWWGMAQTLGIPANKVSDVFQYGEFADLTIVVDENLNIIGGKIHPFKDIQLN